MEPHYHYIPFEQQQPQQQPWSQDYSQIYAPTIPPQAIYPPRTTSSSSLGLTYDSYPPQYVATHYNPYPPSPPLDSASSYFAAPREEEAHDYPPLSLSAEHHSPTVGDLLEKVPHPTHLPTPSYSNAELPNKLTPPPQPTQALPFISKLRYLLSHDDVYGDTLRWDSTGTHFIVNHKSKKLTEEILPTTYQHSKYPSFTRQLNIYGFLRSPPASLPSFLDTSSPSCRPLSEYHIWSHPMFRRDNEEESRGMRPRASMARVREREEKERTGFAGPRGRRGRKVKY